MKIIAIPTYRKSISIGGELRKRLNIETGRYSASRVFIATRLSEKVYTRIYKVPLSTARTLDLAVKFSALNNATQFDAAVYIPKLDFSYLGLKTGDAVGVSTVSAADARSMLLAAATAASVPDAGPVKAATVKPAEKPKTVKEAFSVLVDALPKGSIVDLDAMVKKLLADKFLFRGRATLLEARRTDPRLAKIVVSDGAGGWKKV